VGRTENGGRTEPCRQGGGSTLALHTRPTSPASDCTLVRYDVQQQPIQPTRMVRSPAISGDIAPLSTAASTHAAVDAPDDPVGGVPGCLRIRSCAVRRPGVGRDSSAAAQGTLGSPAHPQQTSPSIQPRPVREAACIDASTPVGQPACIDNSLSSALDVPS